MQHLAALASETCSSATDVRRGKKKGFESISQISLEANSGAG